MRWRRRRLWRRYQRVTRSWSITFPLVRMQLTSRARIRWWWLPADVRFILNSRAGWSQCWQRMASRSPKRFVFICLGCTLQKGKQWILREKASSCSICILWKCIYSLLGTKSYEQNTYQGRKIPPGIGWMDGSGWAYASQTVAKPGIDAAFWTGISPEQMTCRCFYAWNSPDAAQSRPDCFRFGLLSYWCNVFKCLRKRKDNICDCSRFLVWDSGWVVWTQLCLYVVSISSTKRNQGTLFCLDHR